MKQIDTLIVSGASITASPWFTWADILVETLKPKKYINLAARGSGNRWISLSLINAIMDLPPDQNVLCAAMFTNLDKLDMFLSDEQTQMHRDQKHAPIDLKGKPVIGGASFWCTGSHWPLEKKLYLDNFFHPTIAAIDTMMIFNSLAQVCQQKNIDLLPLFDSKIWNILERDLNASVKGVAIPDMDLLADPLVKKFSCMLDPAFIDFVPLINWAIDNKLPYYNDIHKMHPPSNVHYEWFMQNIMPSLVTKYQITNSTPQFVSMIDRLSGEWN